MGEGKLLWGYYPTTKTWVPLQVDANGKVKVDMSAIRLNDLGDLDVPAPGNFEFLLWDAVEARWISDYLLDEDIPATIARDAEVATAVAAEAAARDAAIAAIVLNELADVSVPAPADDDLFYYDDATHLWKSRKLVDADIPAGIARDAEVASAIGDHAALTTGVHGVGAKHVARSSVAALDLAAHASRHDLDGADPLDITLLVKLFRDSNFVIIPTAAGWTETLTGAGTVGQEPMRNYVIITDVNAGSARAHCSYFGFNSQGIASRINWDKHLYIMFNYYLGITAANLQRRIKIDQDAVIGSMATMGIGFEVIDQAMVGEAYGTARGTVSIGTYSMSPSYRQYNIVIELDPDTPAINFYVDGSLAGSITNSNHIPSGISSGSVYVSNSIVRASGGGANAFSALSHGKVWQEI